jgi:hypothetical protein
VIKPQSPTRVGESQVCCFWYQGELCYPKQLERLALTCQVIDSPQDGACLIVKLLRKRSEWYSGIGSSSILAFSIALEIEDDDWERRRIWMYNASGEYLGEDAGPRGFLGRPPETLRFQRGHVVSYLASGASYKLRLGVILGIPPSPERITEIVADAYVAMPDDTDDTYTVYSWDGVDFTHDHLPECYLLEPTGLIDLTQRARLLDLLQTSARKESLS